MRYLLQVQKICTVRVEVVKVILWIDKFKKSARRIQCQEMQRWIAIGVQAAVMDT